MIAFGSGVKFCQPFLLAIALALAVLPCSQAQTPAVPAPAAQAPGREAPAPQTPAVPLPPAPVPTSPGMIAPLSTESGTASPQTRAPLPRTAPDMAPAPATAQQPQPLLSGNPTPSTAPALSLDEAVARASQNSPRLRQSTVLGARARAATRTARAYSNPLLEVYEGRQYARPIATPGVPGLLQHYGGFQPIEIPSERRARREAAVAGERSAQAEAAAVSLSVTANAKHAFFETLRRREEIEHAQENLQLVEDLRRRVEVEVRVGEKGRLELTRAEAEIARARFAVRSAQLEYRNSIALLRAAIAAPPEEELNPQGTLDAPKALPTLPDARATVLRTHPNLAQSQAEIERSQANLRDQKLLRIPQPSAFAEFENQPDLRYWRTGVNISLPLFDRRRGQIDDARATIEGNTAQLQQRRLELISALERAYELYQVADQQVQSLESGELRAAESAVEGAKAAYRFGERGIVEVLDAQRVLQTVRGDLLDARFARQSALVDLQELGVKP